jgi:tRNA G10  N-methylase Trm11
MKVVILGRQPRISLAELISLYGDKIKPLGSSAAIIDDDTIKLGRIGGSLKVGRIIAELTPSQAAQWQQALLSDIDWAQHLRPDGKFNVGLSVYGRNVTNNQLHNLGLQLKSVWRKQLNCNIRLLPSKRGSLGAASIISNHVLTRGADLMLIFDNSRCLVALTEQVQDINDYSRRDYGRPARDPKVGMLPPKLAQILINLAAPPPRSTILDPFCGTGVLLQEALLLGFSVLGSDRSPKMISATRQNLDWLLDSSDIATSQIISLTEADATNHKWPNSINAVISELDLGPPLSTTPDSDRLNEICRHSNQLLSSFLLNTLPQLPNSASLALALPAWHTSSGFRRLNVIDHASALGYTIKQFAPVSQDELIYWRPGQIVGRELMVLIKH